MFREKFDKIKVLTLSHRRDRQRGIRNQLKNIGLEEDGLFLSFQYATSFPFNGLIASAFVASKKGRFTKANEYDCARNHYSIIKEAYDLGYEHILVIEDDIRFLKDRELLEKFIDNIPEDYDLIQFGGFTADPKARELKKMFDNGILWTKHTVQMWTTSMYALSRKGMEYYLAFMNKLFCVADMPLYKAPLNSNLINSYLTTIPVVIQADKEECQSDIRNKENDSIDYNNQNMYEVDIPKDWYFEYDTRL